MPLTVNELRRMCAGDSTYTRGAAYCRQGRVHVVEVGHRDNGAREVSAWVEGSGSNQYQTGLTLSPDGGHVQEYHCSCPAFETWDGMCKHLVALALTVSQSDKPSRPKLSSGPAVSHLLQRYAQQSIDRVPPPIQGMHLEPTLLLSRGATVVSFKVGRERLYVVKDLGQFTDDVRGGKTRSYGKGLTFLHSLGAFDEPGARMAEFLLTYYHKNNNMYDEGYHYFGYDRSRTMLLPPFMLDALLEGCQGRELPVESSRARWRMAVQAGNPRLALHIDRGEEDYTLKLSEKVLVLKGARQLYLGVGGILHRCDPAFSQAVGPLMEAVTQAEERCLRVGEADMPLLLTTLLPQVEHHLRVVSSCDLSELQPPRRQSQVYLDLDESQSVIARLEHHYGVAWHLGFEAKDLHQALDPAGEHQVESLLLRYLPQSGGPGQVRCDEEEGVLELVEHGVAELQQVAEVFASESFRTVRIKPPGAVSVGVRLDAGLLRLHFDLEGLPLGELEEVLSSYRQARKYHRLSDGSFLSLSDGALAEFSALAQGLELEAKDIVAGEIPVPQYRALYLDSLLREGGRLQYVRDGAFKRLIRDVREVRDADFPTPPSLRQVLRNYQKTGYRWLRTLASYGFGGILADDMGLGKTLQVIALLLAQKEEGGGGLSLVVCPASLVLNWESEVARFAPALTALPVVGTAPERGALLQRAGEADVLITSYDLLKRDIECYSAMAFRYVVADEAQYMKNQNTLSAKAVKALRSEVRFALTGTPVENSLAELWSIFDFLMPGYLYHYATFRKRFEAPIARYGDEQAAADLRRLVSPFLLRRMKADVLKELPPKIEVVRYAKLEGEQEKLYQANAALARREVERGSWDSGEGRLQILAHITRLRQLCCDPALVYEDYHGGSAKLELCLELLEDCRGSGHRVLLFSQFTSMLRRIAQRLEEEGIAYSTITGETPSTRRLELVNEFNQGDTPVFLISLKAGGTGLNLTGADVVIHYDPWWNSSAQNQATDRAHRIGQTRTVQVYKLIAKNTLEERILEMQQSKAALAEQIVQAGGGLGKLSKSELLDLFS